MPACSTLRPAFLRGPASFANVIAMPGTFPTDAVTEQAVGRYLACFLMMAHRLVSRVTVRSSQRDNGLMSKRSGWRSVIAAVLVLVLALVVGFILRFAGLSAAANIAQLASVIPLAAAAIRWLVARRGAQGKAGEVSGTLGEVLGTVADVNRLTGQDLRARLHDWGGDEVDAYLSGTRWPGWDFVVAFLDVAGGDDKWVRDSLEKRLRQAWIAGAGDQMSNAGPEGRAAGDGSVMPEIRDWITAARAVGDARRMIARIQESISRNEVLRTVLTEMLGRLSQAVALLTAEGDQDQNRAAPERSSGGEEPRGQADAGPDLSRGTRRRLSEAERLRTATAQRLLDSERQRQVADKLRGEAIVQAEQSWQRLAEVEHRPVSAIALEAAIPQIPGDHADALAGDADSGLAEEVLHRADQILHDEADTLGELGDLLGKPARRAASRRAAVVACAVVVAIGVLVATHLPSGKPGTFPGTGSGGHVRYRTFPIDSPVKFQPISWDFGKGAAPDGYLDQALFEPTQGIYTPGLVFLGKYSLDISAAHAGQNTCRSAMSEHPGRSPVTNLHEGLLICVQGVEGIALLEITQNLDNSKILHVRETYWPGTP